MKRFVKQISTKRAARYVGQFHYTMKLPLTKYAFGLLKQEKLEGVCCFGYGASFSYEKNIEQQGWKHYELVRLVLINNERNDASFLIGGSLKLLKTMSLPTAALIISYADQNWGHVGKIYQATNWIYTGLSSTHTYFELNGKKTHPRSIYSKIGTSSEKVVMKHFKNIKRLEELPKHRYFYCLGSKSQVKKMKIYIDKQFGIQPYPKGNSKKYDIKKIREERNKKSKFSLF